MIRNDFVSNSSSSSFIVKGITYGVLGKLDEGFINIVNRCPDCLYFVTKDEEDFPPEILSEVKKCDLFKVNDDYKYEITLDLTKRQTVTMDQLPLIKNILNHSEKCVFSFGCDDCGEWTSFASQLGTALELVYGFDVEQSEGFEYTSIKKVLKGE